VWQTLRDVIIAGSVVFIIMIVLLGDLVAAIAVGLMVNHPSSANFATISVRLCMWNCC
jgi:hypothetical protein